MTNRRELAWLDLWNSRVDSARRFFLDTSLNLTAYPYCRFYTKEPHFPGSNESYVLAKHIQEKWTEYGIDVTMKKYIIMLSRPKKPGVVALYNGSEEVHRSAPQETFLIPSENNSLVVPPFNAYAPSGSVKVSVYYYRSVSRVSVLPVLMSMVRFSLFHFR